MIEKLFNWSMLSRYITGGDRKTIRPGKVSKKHRKAVDNLIYNELPNWWENKKKEC